MPAAIAPADWLSFVSREYLDGFVRGGGAAVKFVVPMDGGSGGAVSALVNRARQDGYLVASVDAAETRAHLIHEFFFRVAQQIPWQQVASRLVERLAEEAGYDAAHTSRSGTAEPTIRGIAESSGLDPAFVALQLQPLLQDAVFRDRSLARDFRVAMTHLCLAEIKPGTAGNQARDAIVAWLTGEVRTVSAVRPYNILSAINRSNARHHLESMLRFVRSVGVPGVLVTVDASRVTVPRNPKDEKVFYGRVAMLDFYESLRQFIDRTDRMEGLFMLVRADSAFLDDDPKQRGMAAYQALQFRIYDEVRDTALVNPMAALIRLSTTSSGGGS
ncbi:MAG: BREX system ATP-binding domain-containing protein [Dehalococcoidia bacterium]